MLDFLKDEAYLKLPELAKELNVQPELLMLYIGLKAVGTKTMLNMYIDNCTKTGKIIDFTGGEILDVTESNMVGYLPVNNDTLLQIRHYGKYSARAHFLRFTDEKGRFFDLVFTRKQDDSPTKQEDLRIEATIETLYIQNSHAKLIRDALKNEGGKNQSGLISEPPPLTGDLIGDKNIKAFFHPVIKSWGTIKKKLIEHGVSVPDKSKNEVWSVPIAVAIKIKAAKQKK